MVLVDSQDGGLKALRALPIRAPGAPHEALEREKPPTLAGQRLYSKLIGHPRKKDDRALTTPRKLESSCAQRNRLGATRANQWVVTNQSFNPIDRCDPCPRTSSLPN
jgi:hypothetical protein